MSPEEKTRLVALLVDAQHWCQGAEARNAEGHDVAYSDAGATAWDLTGAVCHAFGWRRARELFSQMACHFHGGASIAPAGDPGIAAMVALQNWNDDAQTTHADVIARLQSLPTSAGPGGRTCRPVGDAVPEGTDR